ncbi:MAG: ABC transporter permease [Proteobacteria bacterium]|nr:ABC transporter permease [Pseudomonadota bacterium]
MNGIWSLGYITFKEGIKSRALFGILIMVLFMFAVTETLTDLFMRDIVKVAADLSLSTISFSGLLIVLFIGINLLSKDIDKKTIYMVISRPISREQYILGKLLGIAMLLIVCTLFLGILSSIPVYLSKLSYENPQSIFKWHIYFIAIAFIAMKLILLSSITVFFSSFTSTSFISLVLTIATYIIGSTSEVVKGLLEAKIEGVEISPAVAAVIKFVYYIFPNLSAFDLKIQAAHGLALPSGYILSTSLYWGFYIAIMAVAGALIMRRREFP